ncbi:hypothetical protein TrLO_g14184 [Triparma laevis f. longispina]|uniref:Uncharacterized protein n=1 Tax=Triparma laevis f. longispina TaxID=1714387 RepID=A0A9W7ARV6_9STRA|nr:hypothetical protein TrLO_g14184 [Triparma laevis f. longispina]
MASTIPPRLLDSSKSTIVPLADVPAHLSTFLHSIEDPEMVSRLQGIVDCIEGGVGGGVDFAALIKGGEKRKVEEDEEEDDEKKAKKHKKDKKEKKEKKEKKDKKKKSKKDSP